jgi:hypothetical protein
VGTLARWANGPRPVCRCQPQCRQHGGQGTGLLPSAACTACCTNSSSGGKQTCEPLSTAALPALLSQCWWTSSSHVPPRPCRVVCQAGSPLATNHTQARLATTQKQQQQPPYACTHRRGYTLLLLPLLPAPGNHPTQLWCLAAAAACPMLGTYQRCQLAASSTLGVGSPAGGLQRPGGSVQHPPLLLAQASHAALQRQPPERAPNKLVPPTTPNSTDNAQGPPSSNMFLQAAEITPTHACMAALFWGASWPP